MNLVGGRTRVFIATGVTQSALPVGTSSPDEYGLAGPRETGMCPFLINRRGIWLSCSFSMTVQFGYVPSVSFGLTGGRSTRRSVDETNKRTELALLSAALGLDEDRARKCGGRLRQFHGDNAAKYFAGWSGSTAIRVDENRLWIDARCRQFPRP